MFSSVLSRVALVLAPTSPVTAAVVVVAAIAYVVTQRKVDVGVSIR